MCATAVFFVYFFDFFKVIENQLAKGMFLAVYINKTGLIALHIAIKHDNYKVILALITNKLTKITKKVVKAAAGNENSDKKVIKLFLN